MCLDCVNPIPPKLRHRKTAYKVLVVSTDGELYGELWKTSHERLRGVWLDEKDFREHACESMIECDLSHTKYPAGWHCFTTKQAALAWNKWSGSCVAFKVEVRGLLACGTQDTHEVAVYKEMRIPQNARRLVGAQHD